MLGPLWAVPGREKIDGGYPEPRPANEAHSEGAIALLPPEHKRSRMDSLARWLRRIGPVRSLAVALGSLTLLLLGCYTFTSRHSWHQPLHDSSPQRTDVDRVIRVRLQGRSPKKSIELEVTSPYGISDGTTGRVVERRRPRLSRCKVTASRQGGLQIGSHRLLHGDILITPERDSSIVVNKSTYRGMLRIHQIDGGLAVTNHVDIESYLQGVLRGELPSHFHNEAFKAQCVAARSYALYQKQLAPSGRTWDVLDNEGSQMYIGVKGESRKAIDAVRSTHGEICVYEPEGEEGRFCTYYSSTCGGRTQHVRNLKRSERDIPPLAGNVVCRDCYLARFYRWDAVTISKKELTRRIVARYPSIIRLGTIVDLRSKEVSPDGRIVRIQLDGKSGTNETLMGEDFRLSVGGRVLKSTHFQIEKRSESFIFKDGRGYGHGESIRGHKTAGGAQRAPS